MVKTGVRPRIARILVAGFAALVLSAALLEYPAHSRGAGGGGQPSSKVAVVPSLAPKPYPGSSGVPPLPVNVPEVAKYHFTALPAASVSTAALKGYDTVLLYGILWSDISSSGQAAINAFAAKHKVVIWDSDGTGAQNYSNFVHPFSTLSSGQSYQGKPSDSVISFPTGVNFLASSDPASPYYLNPNQLVKDRDELNDMNAMKSGTQNWLPSLFAANHGIPNGGWPIAWSYGVIGDHTGLTIYSGLDADAFPTNVKLNNTRKELGLDLAAPFRATPDPSCAPHCGLPTVSVGHPFASCGFAKPLSRHWLHGLVRVTLKTSLAAGITAQIVTRKGRVIAKGTEQSGDLVRLVVPTKKLPSNRTSRLRALVFVNGERACTQHFQLKVDNVRPRLLLLATSRGALSLRVSEKSLLSLVGRHVHWRAKRIAAHRTMTLHLPASVRSAQLVLRDRAGNTVVRSLHWR